MKDTLVIAVFFAVFSLSFGSKLDSEQITHKVFCQHLYK